jgi:hypothetical protein
MNLKIASDAYTISSELVRRHYKTATKIENKLIGLEFDGEQVSHLNVCMVENISEVLSDAVDMLKSYPVVIQLTDAFSMEFKKENQIDNMEAVLVVIYTKGEIYNGMCIVDTAKKEVSLSQMKKSPIQFDLDYEFKKATIH